MKSVKFFHVTITTAALAAVILGLAVRAQAQTLSTIFTFTGASTGENSYNGLIWDHAGNLYGTTDGGGQTCALSFGCGTVFELSPNSSGGWTETVLYKFLGPPDGALPTGPLIFDAAGNLYGVTSMGGNTTTPCTSLDGCGVIFKLAPNGDGTWTESVIYSFTGGADGASPSGALTFDVVGNLYGAALNGGTHRCSNSLNCGVVFELSPSSSSWTETVLHDYTGRGDGENPNGGLVFDAAGNLYGTAMGGGASGCIGCGIAFKLSNGSSGWTQTAIHRFSAGRDGGSPMGSLIFDGAGNLYGTGDYGGDPTCGLPLNTNDCGVVFKLTPTSTGTWKETSFAFGFWDGVSPVPGLAIDAAGNLYGAANVGGIKTCGAGYGCGVVFKLTPNATGWTPTVLHRFTADTDGRWPGAGPILDSAGNLYGTAGSGGGFSYGDVYEIKP